MSKRPKPKPLDIMAKNLVARLWEDDVCDAKALVIVRSVLGQVAAEAVREERYQVERRARGPR